VVFRWYAGVTIRGVVVWKVGRSLKDLEVVQSARVRGPWYYNIDCIKILRDIDYMKQLKNFPYKIGKENPPHN
jgi:hypothetical protein